MQRLCTSHLCIGIMLIVLLPLSARAQDFSGLFSNFDTSGLTQQDKRFLQTGLAFEGHYLGLLDGKWGRLSDAAMDQFARAESGGQAEVWHTVALAFSLFQKMEHDGWQMEYLDTLGVSLLVPNTSIRIEETSELFVNWSHRDGSLRYSVGTHSAEVATRFHEYTLEQHSHFDPPYTLRRPETVITTARLADGRALYTRSDLMGGFWSTVILSADRDDIHTLNAVASSIAKGRSRPISFTSGGVLEAAIERTIALIEAEKQQERSNAPALNSEPEQAVGSGTGFVVSDAGHILTNAHVVEGCGAIFVNGLAAETREVSADWDLALLAVAEPAKDWKPAIFSAESAHLNSDVIVAGFPLAGILGGLNITRGSVSSLKGMGGDSVTMQISAPVQPGNSGGPVIAQDGLVVGVVVSVLDAAKMADTMGIVPQNVNFAIRGEIAKLFLSQHGVSPKLGLASERLAPEMLASQSQGFTVFVECH